MHKKSFFGYQVAHHGYFLTSCPGPVFFCICVGHGFQTCNVQLRELKCRQRIEDPLPSGHTVTKTLN